MVLEHAAVRDALDKADQPARGRAATHWEFLAVCQQDGLDDAAIESLREVAKAYERAAYAPMSLDPAEAASVLDAAEPLVVAS